MSGQPPLLDSSDLTADLGALTPDEVEVDLAVVTGQCSSTYSTWQPQCHTFPCPEGWDCSWGTDGLGGGGGAAGAEGTAGAAGSPFSPGELPVDLCPTDVVVSDSCCAVAEACVEPPTFTEDGRLACCYRPTVVSWCCP